MRTPRVYRTEAVILRHRRFGEADQILTVFAPELGKFDAIAKGVRRPTSHKSGHLEELSRTSLLLAHGRSLDIVTQCEVIDSVASLRTDLERLSAALYLAELVDRFSAERQENRYLYELLVECLSGLADDSGILPTVRYFEAQLLGRTGFAPQLRVCTACSGPIDAVLNAFSPDLGGVVCRACVADEGGIQALTVNALKVLRHLQTCSFSEARRLKLTPALSAEVEEHLGRYIRHVLEHEVRSTEFMRSLRALGRDSRSSVVSLEPAATLPAQSI